MERNFLYENNKIHKKDSATTKRNFCSWITSQSTATTLSVNLFFRSEEILGEYLKEAKSAEGKHQKAQ